ncbi:hypothetical protein JCM3770_000274 [Rhodotorula araucariae]
MTSDPAPLSLRQRITQLEHAAQAPLVSSPLRVGPTRSPATTARPTPPPRPAPACPAQGLAPRRASTLSVSPTAAGKGPALPPRPAARAIAPSTVRTAPTLRSSPPLAPSPALHHPPRPSLASKPTTHDPLSLAAAAAAKPYAPPSPSSADETSSHTTATGLARRSPQPVARPPSLASASPARAGSLTTPTPRRALDTRARLRYTRLFDALLAGEPARTTAASATAGAGSPVAPAPATVDAARAAVVWRRSGLPEGELRRIWDDVAPLSASASAGGSMNREAFARGMWVIDEELRGRSQRGATAA